MVYLLLLCFMAQWICHCSWSTLQCFKWDCALWLRCNHRGREFITTSRVRNGYLRIQLTKANTLHQLPGACCLCSLHTVRNNMRSTWRGLKREVYDEHFRANHMDVFALMFCASCKQSLHAERERERREIRIRTLAIISINRNCLLPFWDDSHVAGAVCNFIWNIIYFQKWMYSWNKEKIIIRVLLQGWSAFLLEPTL